MEYTDQWESTNHINVRINQEGGGNVSNLNIGIAMDDGGVASGVCESLSAAAAGVGLVNAAAGAGIGLSSIVCSAL